MKTQRNFVIIKRLNNKQFIHTNLLLASPNYKKQLCESKASGREKERYVKQKDTKKNKFFFRVFCCGKEVTFNLDVFKKRNKKVDMHHISKYNKHKQIQIQILIKILCRSAGKSRKETCTKRQKQESCNHSSFVPKTEEKERSLWEKKTLRKKYQISDGNTDRIR